MGSLGSGREREWGFYLGVHVFIPRGGFVGERVLCGSLSNFLTVRFPYGIRGVSVGTKFAYPGHSNSMKCKNYACYGGRAFGPTCYRAKGSIARRLRRKGQFFMHGCPRVGCLTCFRTCAGACKRLRRLGEGCRRTLVMRSIMKLIVKAHPSYVPVSLLSCLRSLNGHAFMLIRCNVRDASSRALHQVGQKRAFTISTRTIQGATREKVLMKKRVVLNLPKRRERVLVERTKMLSRLPLAALGLRRLRLVGNAHVTDRCIGRPRTFRLCATSRCISLIVSCVRRLHPSVMLRHFISRSPGRLLVTPS